MGSWQDQIQFLDYALSDPKLKRFGLPPWMFIALVGLAAVAMLSILMVPALFPEVTNIPQVSAFWLALVGLFFFVRGIRLVIARTRWLLYCRRRDRKPKNPPLAAEPTPRRVWFLTAKVMLVCAGSILFFPLWTSMTRLDVALLWGILLAALAIGWTLWQKLFRPLVGFFRRTLAQLREKFKKRRD